MSFEIVIRETANAYGVPLQSVRDKVCGEDILAAAVGILNDLGIESPGIAQSFGRETGWVHKLKVRAAQIKDTPRYKAAKENSDSAVMAESLGGDNFGGATENESMSSDAQENSQDHEEVDSSEKAEQLAQDPICAKVLEKGFEYFGTKPKLIVSGESDEEVEAREKCVKAMKVSGASIEQIRKTFKAPDNAWVQTICDKVSDDDGDVEMLKLDNAETNESEEPSQPIQNTEQPEDMNADHSITFLAKIANALGSNLKLLLEATDRDATSKRAIAAMTMRECGYSADEIVTAMKKTGGWFYQNKAKITAEQKKEIDRLVALLGPRKDTPKPKERAPKPAPPQASAPALKSSPEPETESSPALGIELTRENSVEVHGTQLPPSEALSALCDTIYAEMCPGSVMLLAADPQAQLQQAREVMCLLAMGRVPLKVIVATSQLPEAEICRMAGYIGFKVYEDPILAKKIRRLNRLIAAEKD